MEKLYKPAGPSHSTRILIGVFSNSLYLTHQPENCPKWGNTNARTLLVLNGSSLTPSHLDFSVGINHVLSCQSSCLIGIRKELRKGTKVKICGMCSAVAPSDKDNQALGLPATTKVFAP